MKDSYRKSCLTVLTESKLSESYMFGVKREKAIALGGTMVLWNSDKFVFATGTGWERRCCCFFYVAYPFPCLSGSFFISLFRKRPDKWNIAEWAVKLLVRLTEIIEEPRLRLMLAMHQKLIHLNLLGVILNLYTQGVSTLDSAYVVSLFYRKVSRCLILKKWLNKTFVNYSDNSFALFFFYY